MGSLKSMAIAFLAPLPSVLFFLSFLHHHHHPPSPPSPLWSWCADHPLLLANLLFFLNVDLLFWLLGLLQSNHWLIDLYWTVIPLLLLHYYRAHPAGEGAAAAARSWAAAALTWAWSARLTHNYLRREGWEWGRREDWRFAEMRAQHGARWWWVSFFSVYLSQQVFLIGICLPLYAIHSSSQPWGIWDFVATTVCVAGIVVAHFGDTQLHRFVKRNEKLKQLGEPVVPTLEEGLWRYSRHPNYFGEQLWWWGLYLFAWNLGEGWMFVGPLVNSLCLGYVTVLVERRMLRQEHRAEAYRQYQKRTSVWIPWFRRAIADAKQKEI